MRYKYRIVKKANMFQIQIRETGFIGIVNGWQFLSFHLDLSEARARAKYLINRDKEDKKLKVIEVFEP